MGVLTSFIGGLLGLLVALVQIVVGTFIGVESGLRAGLAQLGTPPLVQTFILAGIAIFMIVGSLRLFSGVLRIAIVLFLILISMHIFVPVG